jgi:hypothetical protein
MNFKNISVIASLILALSITLSFSQANPVGILTPTSSLLMVATDATNGDYIKIWNNSTVANYLLYANDVSPAKFALILSMMREFFINSNQSGLYWFWSTQTKNGVSYARIDSCYFIGK